MESRLDYAKLSPNAIKAMFGLQAYVNVSSLPHSVQALVKMRASQINGCAFCIDMHSKDARAAGETEQRLYALDAWRETPFFTPQERAALAWTEAITLIRDGHAPDALYAEVREHFSESEVVDLTLAIVAINSWNRLSIAFRTPPGSYVPGKPVFNSLTTRAA